MTASAPSGARYGVTSMVAPLRRVLVRTPATRRLGRRGLADARTGGARAPTRGVRRAARRLGVEVELANALEGQVDSVYMHDPLVMSGQGGIPLNMAKPARRREPGHAKEEFERLDIPVLGALEGDAYADGGDRFWLDDTRPRSGSATAPTARAPRPAGAPESRGHPRRGLRHGARPGPGPRPAPAVVPVGRDRGPLRRLRAARPGPPAPGHPERGIDWIAIDEESYHGMGCNVLAVRPGVVVMVEGAPRVRHALEQRGVEVHVYDGTDLILKGDGGPTCLTAPLLRA